MKRTLAALAFVLILNRCPMADAELVMDTHGMVSFSPYIHGMGHTYDTIRLTSDGSRTQKLSPSYRAEFLAIIDFVRWNRLVLTGTVGNTTMISSTDSSLFTLNRVHYLVSPGFRYEWGDIIFRTAFHHESIHSLSRSESFGRRTGPYWQNSIRFGMGTRGAYWLYLRDEYLNVNNRFLNYWDAQVNAGVFIRGSDSIWQARNNPYRAEQYALIRYHLGVFRNWAYFASFRQFLWLRMDRTVEQNFNITLNAFRKGAVNFFGVFYTYTIYDDSTEDNENRLGALGLRIVF